MGYKWFKYVKLVIFIYILLTSCNNSEDLTLGSNFIDNTTKIFQIDTFTVELSTVIIDSIITSETRQALVGNYEDGELGKITAKYFSQIVLPGFTDIDEDNKFDSITIVMPYNSYFYGDTTIEQKIDIHLLNEELWISDDYYYNTSNFEYQVNSIGSEVYLPRPVRDSLIEFRIDDQIGIDLFEKLISDAEEVQSNDNFQNYIYGIAIIPDNSNSSVIGFYQSGMMLKLYISTSGGEIDLENNQTVYNFAFSGDQFSRIIADRSGTILQTLTNREESLNSNLTKNRSYIQAGTGILTKVSFPYINSILFDSDNITLSAELILRPAIESYAGEFPEYLSIYLTDENNNFDIYDEDNFLGTSMFFLDEKYHKETQYTFDITQQIKDQISNGYFDSDLGFLLAIPSPNFSSTLERLIVSAEQDPDKRPILKITYLEN